VRDKLCNLDERMAKIVVTHHPFDLPDTLDPDHIVGRARMAMRTLARCGADILLAGHAHVSHVGDTTARYKFDDYAALVVQAGTATSTRARGESNSFNTLRIVDQEVCVQRHAWQPEAGEFAAAASEVFSHTPRGWVRKALPSGDTHAPRAARSGR
jgi:3',5'-cyclic AMP phosphodiesterase CpdA